MKTKQPYSDADGLIAALQVVGVHGRFDDGQTPTRAAPVLADSQGRQVAIREASPAKNGGFRLTIDTARRKIDDDVWSTTGTRIDPP